MMMMMHMVAFRFVHTNPTLPSFFFKRTYEREGMLRSILAKITAEVRIN